MLQVEQNVIFGLKLVDTVRLPYGRGLEGTPW